MAGRQGRLDLGLPFHQPIHGGVQLVLVRPFHPQDLGQGGDPTVRGAQPGQGPFAARVQHPPRHQGQGQVLLPAAAGGEQAVQFQLAQGAHHRGDMPMGAGLDQLHLPIGRADGFPFQPQLDHLDHRIGQGGDVGHGGGLDLVAFAVGMA